MPSRKTRNVSLTPGLDAFVDGRVASGRYRSASEVVRAALRLLEVEEVRGPQPLGTKPLAPRRARACGRGRDFLAGGSAMGALMRAHDWAATPLGPPEAWPQSLRAAVRLALGTRHPVFIFWGRELTCLYNDASSATMGPERHPSALGRPGRKVWDEIWDIIGPQIQFVMSGRGATWHEDLLVPITRHGRREDVWWTSSYSPILDEDAPGGIGGVLVLYNDVTEEHLARKALREGEERFRLLIEDWAQAVWETDAKGAVVADSPSWRAYTGQSEREWLGQGWLDAVHPDDRAHAERRWREAVAARRPVEAEFRLRHAGGGWRWTNIRAAPLIGPGGTVAKWVAMNIDITERKEAEAELRAREAEFRAAFEQSPVPMHQTDCATGRIMRVNPAFCRLVGRPAEDILDRPVSDMTHPDDRETNLAAFLRMARGEQAAHEAEKRYLRPDGTVRWVRFSSALVRDASGRPLRTVAVAQDITEQKEAEAALRDAEARSRTLFDAAPFGVIVVDPATHEILDVNDYACAEYGYNREEFLRLSITDIDALGDSEAIRVRGRAHKIRPGTQEFEAQHRRKSGELRDVLVRAEGICLGGRDVTFGAHFDITDRKAAEARQRLLMRELDHRSRNALAVVQAALRLTPRDDPEAYAAAVEGRVKALARAHTLLAEGRWDGAELHALLTGELAPFLAGQRVELDGPPVMLPAGVAQSLAMAVHELATNAVKHGSLSVPEGHIAVSWRFDRKTELLRLRWSEAGGPPVTGPPRRRGFGSRVLDATMRGQLGGAVSLAWNATGLVCEIEMPLGTRAPAGADAPVAALAGRRRAG